MVVFAICEAYMEGEGGWKWNPKWWRIKLPKGYSYTAYHMWAYFVFGPLVFIFFPLLIAGFSARFFWILVAGYLLGTTIEDFMWFVVNPYYSLAKWNPKEVKWYPWVQLGKLAIPVSYVIKLSLAAAILGGLNFLLS